MCLRAHLKKRPLDSTVTRPLAPTRRWLLGSNRTRGTTGQVALPALWRRYRKTGRHDVHWRARRLEWVQVTVGGTAPDGRFSRGRPRPAFRPQYGSHGDLYRGGLCKAAGAETSHPRINAYLSAKEVARHLARASFGGSCVPLKSSAATIQHAANQSTHPVRRLTVADVSSQRMGYGRRHLAPGITCDQIAWQKKPASATCHPARSGAVLDRVGRLGDLRGVKALLTLPEGRDGIRTERRGSPPLLAIVVVMAGGSGWQGQSCGRSRRRDPLGRACVRLMLCGKLLFLPSSPRGNQLMELMREQRRIALNITFKSTC